MKYTFNVNSERSYFLPGETAKINYFVLDLSTLATAEGVTIYYIAQWWNHTGNKTMKNYLNSTLSTSNTVHEFLIDPEIALNRSPAVQIDYWANATNRSEHASISLHVDVIKAAVDTELGSYNPGDTVVVTVDSQVDNQILPGATVNVVVKMNGTEVISAYGASNLTTDVNGEASYAFTLTNTTMLGTYVVVADVSKLGHSTERQTTFTVDQFGNMFVTLDKDVYIGGEQVKATFQPVWNHQVVEVGTIAYLVFLNGNLLVSSNTTSTSATVDLPEDFSGMVMVNAIAEYKGFMLSNIAFADVIFADLGLTAVKDSYRPGDTITWSWSLVTSLTTGTLTYEIVDSFGVRVATGSPEFAKTGTIKYEVPTTNPAEDYTATLRMTTPSGGFRTADASVGLVDLTELKISVGKSPYANGLFKPGEKISINFVISTYVFGARPAYRIHLVVDFDPIEIDHITTTAKGHIDYTIPKDTPMAQVGIEATLFDATGGPSISSDATAFTVNNRQSAWDLSAGGISLINLIILVLLVIVVIALIIWPWGKKRMEMGPKATQPVTPAMPEEGKTPPPPSP
jgi:hypothetical protein